MENRPATYSGYSPFRMMGKQHYRKDLSITSDKISKRKLCGIYYLTDGLDVLYVGKSKDVEARLNQHRSSDIDFSQVFVDQCEPHELDALESKAIARYNPPFNERP